ncbi:E3 ubiquitin-protein ligase TRIM50 [Clupea harengus]|uniref:E3 ubiquitin-protein ligase TRIM50 n=1 Tax=Clupea harengus TaxID=7950 RepID=A0A6P3VRY2_CLUHA|nr:E3 ubiquitin-protein ligase TRIM50 [Clupea harengus]XP_031424364.1 E3 ubiquitin-protein ligase TRIM50 [Clupea harengus]
MMKDCLQFLIEPAKNLKIRIKESRKKVKHEKKEPLLESQLFIMDLARELNRLCQKSDVLAHIWTCEDVWPPNLCREFIMEWSATLENKQRSLLISPPPERRDWRGHLLSMLEQGGQGGEHDMGLHRCIIMDWVREQKAKYQHGVWPGEPVLMVLDDLEFQWRRGRLSHLRSAMELVIWAVRAQSAEKETIPRLWLAHKQRNQNIDATRYVPHALWNWICDAAEEVTLDPETANPDLVISDDNKRMRCGYEKRDMADCRRRFNGWWCALGSEGFSAGRHYWEVEVGDRDWRLGVARASALRHGYRSLNTESGYLTLRLERGQELKALTVPYTSLPPDLPLPRKVGVYLDYEGGQLSFYDVERRAHLYSYTDTFSEKLYPVFGTVEVVRDMVIREARAREPCFCPGPCLWS